MSKVRSALQDLVQKCLEMVSFGNANTWQYIKHWVAANPQNVVLVPARDDTTLAFAFNAQCPFRLEMQRYLIVFSVSLSLSISLCLLNFLSRSLSLSCALSLSLSLFLFLFLAPSKLTFSKRMISFHFSSKGYLIRIIWMYVKKEQRFLKKSSFSTCSIISLSTDICFT